MLTVCFIFFFFSSRRRHTRSDRDWSSDVCSSDLLDGQVLIHIRGQPPRLNRAARRTVPSRAAANVLVRGDRLGRSSVTHLPATRSPVTTARLTQTFLHEVASVRRAHRLRDA